MELLILPALVAAIILGPPVFVGGDRAYATQFWIRMPHPAKRKCWAAIFAQELVEFWARWLLTALFSAPIVLGAYAYAGEAWWFLAIVAVLLVSRFAVVELKPVLRQLELLGHAVEIVEAQRLYGAEPAYAAEEAERMRRGYGKLFSGMSKSEIMTKLRSRAGIARIAVAPFRWRINRARKQEKPGERR